MFDLRWTAAALALAAAACDDKADAPAAGNQAQASAAPIPAPNGQDWTLTVAATPEGGFVMGNPNAPVKVVEYASLTCPHCADFSINSGDKLKDAVRTGRVSWEFRNFILNPVDIAASLLARCQGADPFFALVEQTFAEQKNWLTPAFEAVNAQQARLNALSEAQLIPAMAEIAKLPQFYAERGLPEAKGQQCLTDKAAIDTLLKVRDLGSNQDKVTGTPAFLVNGKLAEGAYDWNTLKAAIDAAS